MLLRSVFVTSLPRHIFILWALYFLPLSITLGYVGDKPVDFVASDLLLLLLPIWFVMLPHLPSRFGLAIIFLGYFLAVGFAGAFGSGGSMENILSSVTFSLPFLHIFIGGFAFNRWGWDFVRPAPLVFAIVVLLIFVSDILFGSFPRGCGVEGRWGGCFLNIEVYGFVNSSTGYLAVVSGILYVGYIAASRLSGRALMISSISALFFIIPMSLSRSATVTFFFIFLVGIFAIGRWIAAAGVLFASLFLPVAVPLLEDSVIGRGITSRVASGIDRGDIASGRFEIWRETLALIQDAPLFGYKFGFFSNFSFFGTAHNQYLEVMFKSGIIGFAIYFSFLIYIFSRFVLIHGDYGLRKGVMVCAVGLFAGMLINSFSQPLMNYSVMANLIFLAAGIIMAVPLGNKR
jgi:O-antigen ligase